MNKTKSTIVAAAVSGLLMGSMQSCAGSPETGGASAAALAVTEKHACKGMNSCANKGGCKAGDNGCAGKNSCEKKGGCATVAHHGCKGMNSCKGQGGCGSGDNGCGGKNSCKGKGGCAVPINMKK